ncbi:MAG: hypothetical protein HQ527_07300 [Cyanobacteria bacterium]|nr:hypothetical protein [Cyanobacteria bacterium bin.51]
MNGSGDPVRRGKRRSAGSTLDQWVTAGRQLVDGVAGARPGSRTQARGGERGRERPSERPSFKGVGRWMENQLDSFMEEEDDWSERSPESWQQSIPEELRSPPAPFNDRIEAEQAAAPPPAAPQQRRLLDAISRRAAPLLPPASASPRPLPRSSRRRP